MFFDFQLNKPILNLNISPSKFPDSFLNKRAFFINQNCGNLSICRCSFIDCYSSDNYGGGILILQRCFVIMHSCIFNNCHSFKHGGAGAIANEIEIEEYLNGYFDQIFPRDPIIDYTELLDIQYSCIQNCYSTNGPYLGSAFILGAKNVKLYYASTVNCPKQDNESIKAWGAQFDISSDSVSSSNVNATSGNSIYCGAMEYRDATSGFFRFQTITSMICKYAISFTSININGMEISYSNMVNNTIISSIYDNSDSSSPALILVRKKNLIIKDFYFAKNSIYGGRFVEKEADDVILITLSNCYADINDASMWNYPYINIESCFFDDAQISTYIIAQLNLGDCMGVRTPPPILTNTFTQSSFYKGSNVFTDTNKFSFSKHFSESSKFSQSHKFNNTDYFSHSDYLTKSSYFTLSNKFSQTNIFTSSKLFSNSNLFSYSSLYSNSYLFTYSNAFSNSNGFSRSQAFSSSNEFIQSNAFSDSNRFSYSQAFSSSNEFIQSNAFSDSNRFSYSQAFSDSKGFIQSNVFSNSNKFSLSRVFSNSNEFIQSNVFSDSNKFSKSFVFNTSRQFSKTEEFSISEAFSHSFYFSFLYHYLNSNTFSMTKTFVPTCTYSSSSQFTKSFQFSQSYEFTTSDFFTETPTQSRHDQKITHVNSYIETYILKKSVSMSLFFSSSITYTITYNEEIGDYSYVMIGTNVDFYVPYIIRVYSRTFYATMITYEYIENKKKITSEQLIGIVCGSVAVFFTIFGIVLLLVKKQNRSKFISNEIESDFSSSSDVVVTQKTEEIEVNLNENKSNLNIDDDWL